MAYEVDFECPECGYLGPHRVVERSWDTLVLECGDCKVEFDVPED